jgi:hypothetical protein
MSGPDDRLDLGEVAGLGQGVVRVGAEEEGRRDGHIAELGQTAAGVADVLVHAEHL